MKKIFSLLIIAVLVVTLMVPVAFAAGTTVSAEKVTAAPGETVVVAVSISGNTGFATYNVTVSYDAAALELVSIDDAKVFSGIFYGNVANGGATFMSAVDVTGDGDLFNATFKVLAETNGEYPVTVTVNNFGKADSQRLSVPASAGSVTVKVDADKCTHSYGDWTVTKAATCTEDGEQTRTCTKCGNVETQTIKSEGHGYGDWTVTKAATCTEDGEQTRTCTKCGDVETKTIKSEGHKYGDWVVTKEATCSEAGVKTRTCSVCTEVETEEIPATGKHVDSNKDDICDECGADLSSKTPVVTPTTKPSKLPFTDVSPDDWFYEDVVYVYTNGLMNGITSTTFGPNVTTTRGMIVTILYRLEGEPKVTGACTFDDVEAGSYYEDAITWAAAKGIVTGYSETAFGPDDQITREQMAAIVFRYADYKGYDVSARADLSKYADVDEISAYAKEAMSWANAKGLITGRTSTTLAPKGTATRAEVAAILHRFCTK